MIDRQVNKKRLEWVFTSLVFFALPILVVLYGLGSRMKIHAQQEFRNKSVVLQDILLLIRKDEDTKAFFEKMFKKLWEKSLLKRKPITYLKTVFRRINKRFLGIFNFTLIDSKGNLIPKVSREKPDLKAVFTLYRELRKDVLLTGENENNKAEILASYDIIRPFVGEYSDVGQLEKQKFRLEVVNFSKEKRWFTYYADYRYGAFVHIDNPENWVNLALIDGVNYFRNKLKIPDLKLGLEDLNLNQPSDPIILKAITIFKSSKAQQIYLEDRIYNIMETSPNTFLWASLPFPHFSILSIRRLQISILGTLVFAIAAFISMKVFINNSSFCLSIRHRLTLLFFYAGGLPVIVLLMAGWEYMEQKSQAKIQETYGMLEKALYSLETNFSYMRGEIESTVTKIMKKIKFSTAQQKEKTKIIFKKLRKALNCHDIYVYHKSGKMLWKATEEYDDEMRTVRGLGKLIKNIIMTLNQETSKSALDIDPVTLVMESFGGIGNPVQVFTRNLGRMFLFSLAGVKKNIWMIFYPLWEPDGKVEYLARFFWKALDLEIHFVNTRFPKVRRLYPNTKFLYCNIEHNWRYPHKYFNHPQLERFLVLVTLQKATTAQKIFINGKPYLAVGTRMKEIEGSYLIALRSERYIQAEIAKLRKYLGLFAGSVIGICLFLGFLLAKRFLEPVSKLSEGVQALQARNFSYRIPEMDADEFGILGRTFNQVVVGMEDLDVGRIVQESLFPKGLLSVGTYRIFGTSVAAGELGGDYFDYQLLPNGNVIIVIGDVSGHGLPAALVMGMARAIIERECMLDPNPEVVLQNLHRVILNTMKRKRMMTCFMALLNPETHTLYSANAGHNYPYLFRIGSEPQPIETSTTPLGSRKVLKLIPQTHVLQPGDKLFFYTDGLIEAKVRGVEVGYQRMTEAVSKLLSDDPIESIQKISEWHRGLTGDHPQEDDITMVLLARTGHGYS